MVEDNGMSAQGNAQPESVQKELAAVAELARLRSSLRLYKIVAIVSSSLLLLIAAGGFVVFRKVMQAKSALEHVMGGFAPLASAENSNIPQPLRLPGQGDQAAPVQSSLSMFSMPGDSGLGGGSGSAPEDLAPRETQQTFEAMKKYADRPLVREFMADLKKDPSMGAVLGGGGNPLAMIGAMQKSTAARGLLLKYARRPEFMQLMQEVMQDPEMRPLMSRVPGAGGLMGAAGSDAAGGAAPRPARMPLKAAPAGTPAASSDADNDGELTFDAAAVSGSAAPRYKSGTPPPPVDSGR